MAMLAVATLLAMTDRSAHAVNKALSSLVNHDYATAYKEFKIQADQGDAPAQYNLGVMCKNGKGMPPNFTEAFKWFHLAAAQGHVRAQSNLAMLYASGQGVKQDYVQAYMWAELAGKQGDAASLKLKDKLEKSLTPAQLAEAQQLARAWKPAAK
jgi:TPR repeat protein